MLSAQLLDNYGNLQKSLDVACSRACRSRDEITLVAVSKFHPAENIAVIAGAGQIDFGENYLQEAEAKMATLAPDFPNLRWHMIGHVQSRKASHVAGNFVLVHTLDSSKLADGMERRLVESDKLQAVLIEVNIADEPQKSGVSTGKLEELGQYVLEHCPHLNLCGLMCLPPVFDSGEAARPYFARLRRLKEKLAAGLGIDLPHLSMGMSGDFEAAIAEGATIVRIGTDIFGPRPPKKTN